MIICNHFTEGHHPIFHYFISEWPCRLSCATTALHLLKQTNQKKRLHESSYGERNRDYLVAVHLTDFEHVILSVWFQGTD